MRWSSRMVNTVCVATRIVINAHGGPYHWFVTHSIFIFPFAKIITTYFATNRSIVCFSGFIYASRGEGYLDTLFCGPESIIRVHANPLIRFASIHPSYSMELCLSLSLWDEWRTGDAIDFASVFYSCFHKKQATIRAVLLLYRHE